MGNVLGEIGHPPSSKTVENFDPEKYQGLWYELARYPFGWEKGCLYATAYYEWNQEEKKLSIKNTCHNNKTSFSMEGEAVPTSASGKLIVGFKINPAKSSYWIHWTDYDNFSIVGSPSGRYMWILSRKKHITSQERKKLMTLVYNYGYHPTELVWNYYPKKFKIENETKINKNYRKVLETYPGGQLVVMSLRQNEDIPWEKHSGAQFIRVESGQALVKMCGQEIVLDEDETINIPAGVMHYIKNNGKKYLKLYSVYGVHEHPDGLVQERQDGPK